MVDFSQSQLCYALIGRSNRQCNTLGQSSFDSTPSATAWATSRGLHHLTSFALETPLLTRASMSFESTVAPTINVEDFRNVTPSEGSPQSSRWPFMALFLIPIFTIWGNVLVCLSVYLEKRLKNRFNYFLVSLATSDLLCAALVMPFSAWKMVRGK